MNYLKQLLNKNFYITIVIIFFLMMMICVIAIFDSPYMGLNFEYKNNNWYISSIEPHSPASHYPEMKGAHVESIAGISPARYGLANEFDDIPNRQELISFLDTRKYFSEHIRIGEPFEMTIVKNETKKQVSIKPERYPVIVFMYKAGLIIIIGIISVLTGLIVILQKLNEPKAVVFFFLTLFLGGIDIPLGIFIARDIGFNFNVFMLLFVVSVSSIFLTATTMFHFCTIFPEKKQISKNPFLIYFIYFLAVISIILYGNRILFQIYPVFCLTMIFGALGGVIHSYMSTGSPVMKAQVKMILLGAMLSLLTFPLVYFIPMILTGYRIVSAYIPMASTILLPLSMGFAIIRYRLMDIDNLFDKTVTYILTVILLSIIDVSVVMVLVNNVHASEFAADVAALWLILILYLPVRDMVARFIKKFMNRDIYNLHEVSMKLNRRLLSVNSIYDTLEVVTGTITEILHPAGWEILMKNENGTLYRYTNKDKEPIPVLWAQSLKTEHSDMLYNISGAADLPDHYSGGVIIPLIGSKGLICYILLQDKKSGRLYSQEELELFDIIAGQAAMCIDSVTSREESGFEKERISREIHDGIGNNLAQAIVLTNLSQAKPDMITKLKNLLNESLNNLRELIWTIEPGHSSVKDLFTYISDSMQYMCANDDIVLVIESHTENPDLPVSSQIKLNIIRIVQESITNIIKHANANMVEITLVENKGEIIVRVFDNGKGFNTFKNKVNGYGIRNIKKRCETIDCKCELNSEPGTGTEIIIGINLPISAESDNNLKAI